MSADKKADAKPFILGVAEGLKVGAEFTVAPASGPVVKVKLTQEIHDEALRLGLGTALQNKYADSKAKGWATPAAKGDQSRKLAEHWATAGTWSMERTGGGVSKAAVVAGMLAEIEAMDIPAEVKAMMKAKFAA